METQAKTRLEMLTFLSSGRSRADGPSPMVLPLPPSKEGNKDGLLIEHVSILTEVGERCPLLLVREASRAGQPLRPVFIMHGTNQSKSSLLDNGFLQRIARMGLLAVGLDSRHHGDRSSPDDKAAFGGGTPSPGGAYWPALVRAWRSPHLPPPPSSPSPLLLQRLLCRWPPTMAAITAMAAVGAVASRTAFGGSPATVTAAVTAAVAAVTATVATATVTSAVMTTGRMTGVRAQYRYPFMYDTVWDLMRVLDFLETRTDVDTSRVGATGISLGARVKVEPGRTVQLINHSGVSLSAVVASRWQHICQQCMRACV
jgi:hypothetical protein